VLEGIPDQVLGTGATRALLQPCAAATLRAATTPRCTRNARREGELVQPVLDQRARVRGEQRRARAVGKRGCQPAQRPCL